LARKPKDDIKGTLPVSVFTMVHEVKRQLLAIRDLIS